MGFERLCMAKHYSNYDTDVFYTTYPKVEDRIEIYT
jgi:hypothetical protein